MGRIVEPPRPGRRFRGLFGALLVFVIVVPLATRGPFGVAILQLAITVVSVTAAWAIGALRRRSAVTLVAILLALNLSTVLTGSRVHVGVALAGLVVFLAWVIASVVVRLAGESRVTSDTLYGAVIAYLLMGIAFAVLYGLVGLGSPGALGGLVRRPIQESLTVLSAGSEFPQLLYFSLVTLSTLGYGDVTPANDIVRMLAPIEAILGQLYVAVVIARLVGLHLFGSSEAE